MALTDKLTAIADAIRSKTQTTEALSLPQMATVISDQLTKAPPKVRVTLSITSTMAQQKTVSVRYTKPDGTIGTATQSYTKAVYTMHSGGIFQVMKPSGTLTYSGDGATVTALSSSSTAPIYSITSKTTADAAATLTIK